MSAECPHNGDDAADAHCEQNQNKTAAPGGIRRGGDSSAIDHGKPKARSIYTAAASKPRAAGDVRRLRTLLLHAINEDHELTPHSRIVGVFLCGLVNVHTEQAWPSAEHISERLGISKRTVYRAIQQLEGRYFTVVRSKHAGTPGDASSSDRRSNTYRPIWPPEHLDPERIGDLSSRVLTAEQQDANAAQDDPSPGRANDDIAQAHGAEPEGDNGDNGDAETVTENAPNHVDGNKYAQACAREAASEAGAEPSSCSLSGGVEPDASDALDPVTVKRAFREKFGLEAYRSHFARVRIQGSSAVFPSQLTATRADRFHAFLKRHGVRHIEAEDRPGWRLELRPSRIAQPSRAHIACTH